MKTITLEIPDQTYERLYGVARYQDITLKRLGKDILITAEKEIWKSYGRHTEEMLKGLDYFNAHCR